jgi:hypothetical protein
MRNLRLLDLALMGLIKIEADGSVLNEDHLEPVQMFAFETFCLAKQLGEAPKEAAR